MELKEEIRKEILENNSLSLELAMVLKKTQAAVKHSARRGSRGLDAIATIDVYRKYGFKEIYKKDEK